MKRLMRILPAASLAALALTVLSDTARADDFRPEAATCAKLYKAVQHERDFDFDDGDFWRFSNALQIDFGQRAEILRARAPDALAFDIATMEMGRSPAFPAPGSDEAGFNDLNPLRLLEPPPSSATPPYGRWLTMCDEAHGFAPVFSFGASPAPTITHLQCARDYFTLALLAPYTQEVLRPRIRQAAAADAGRQMADEEVRARLDGDARERGRGIQSGRERPEALVADVYACDRHYGHEPIRLQ